MKGATNWKDQLAQLIFSRLYCVATANYISPSWATNYELQAFSHWTYEVVTSIYTADNYYFQLKFPQMKEKIIVTTVRCQILKSSAKLITCQVGFEGFFDKHVSNLMCQLSNTEFERETRNLQRICT